MNENELNSPGYEIPPEMQSAVSITTLDRIYNWSRRASVWPMMFGLACCAIEFICTAASRYDLARFGMEVLRPSPRQSDLMIISGTVTKKMIPTIVRLYNQMPEPKYVLAMGACAAGGGPFKDGYNVVSGVDKFLPVDVYVPGCPPTPQALLYGLIKLQEKISQQSIKKVRWYRKEPIQEIPIPVLGPDLNDMRKIKLIKENRKGTCLIDVKASLKDEFDYTLLGYAVGKLVGYGIPVLTGLSRQPTTEELINFCAMSNVPGAVSMFYMPGFTVEASSVEEAFQGDKPKDKFTVTDNDLKQTYKELQTTSGKIDFVMLGCPHYTLKQVEEAAGLLKGKKMHKGVSFWICTSATTKLLAERAGLVGTIEKAGGNVVVDTCIDEPCWVTYYGGVGMTDSPKCAYYRRFKEAIVSRLEDCVEAAVEGRWK